MIMVQNYSLNERQNYIHLTARRFNVSQNSKYFTRENYIKLVKHVAPGGRFYCSFSSIGICARIIKFANAGFASMIGQPPFFWVKGLRNMFQGAGDESTRETQDRVLRARSICIFKRDLSYL